MSHLTEGRLQSYLDGEVSAAERAEVDAHLPDCSLCREELGELRELSSAFSSAVRLIDGGVVAFTSEALAEVRAQTMRRRAPRFALSRSALLKAAMLVLGLSAAASATVPGSPVRRWAGAAWRQVAELFADEKTVPPAAAIQEVPPAPEPVYTGGISIVPAAGRVRVVVRSPAPGTRIHVQLVDDENAWIQVAGEAASASFTRGSSQIEVSGGGVGDVRILLPRTLPSATVVVDGRVYLTKEGANLKYFGPAADTVGTELIFQPTR